MDNHATVEIHDDDCESSGTACWEGAADGHKILLPLRWTGKAENGDDLFEGRLSLKKASAHGIRPDHARASGWVTASPGMETPQQDPTTVPVTVAEIRGTAK